MDGATDFLKFQVAGLDRATTGPIQFALEGLPEKERIGVDGFTIGGRVTAGKGLATVVVTVNGAEVATVDDRRAPKPEIALKVPVKLRDGKNVVIVTATDAEGTSRQEARSILYLPPGGSPGGQGRASVPGATRPGEQPVAPPQATLPREPTQPQAPPAQAPRLPQVASVPPASAPLQVTLSSPTEQARVENETVALAGLASGGRQVRRVVVSVNGLEVSRPLTMFSGCETQRPSSWLFLSPSVRYNPQKPQSRCNRTFAGYNLRHTTAGGRPKDGRAGARSEGSDGT